MPYEPRIAIIGGGPGGLALGLLLRQRGITPTIYDLRSQPTPQELAKPSGMLDLHEESGLKVVRECGQWESFQAALGDCSEACRVLNPKGDVLHTDDGGLEARPEIARHALTGLLLQKMPADGVKWNQKIISVQESRNSATGTTEFTLALADGNTATYDFVVGADGAWSRVRNLLTDAKPSYRGAQFITATVRNVATHYPHLLELNGSGTLMALGGGNAMMTHRGPQDSIRLYASLSTPHEKWAQAVGVQGKTPAELKTTLLGDDELFGKWAPQLQDLLKIAFDEDTKDNPDQAADILPLYMLPVGHRWEHRAGVTLLGDAAHLMTPFAGEGVNLALWDALDLAHALGGVGEVADAAAWQAGADTRVREYEATALARAEEKAEESSRNTDVFLSENGAEQMASFFTQAYAATGPPQ